MRLAVNPSLLCSACARIYKRFLIIVEVVRSRAAYEFWASWGTEIHVVVEHLVLSSPQVVWAQALVSGTPEPLDVLDGELSEIELVGNSTALSARLLTLDSAAAER